MKFEISEIELLKLKEFQKNIKKEYGFYGTYAYTFIPTGIGNSIEVKSYLSGKAINITDYESW